MSLAEAELVQQQRQLLTFLQSLRKEVELISGNELTVDVLWEQQKLLNQRLQSLAMQICKLTGEKPQDIYVSTSLKSVQSDGKEVEQKDWSLKYLASQPQKWSDVYRDLMRHDTEVNFRLRVECRKLGLKTWRFKRVAKDYYEWPLEKRQVVLGAPGVEYLCKSVIMQNTKCTRDDCQDPTNSKYYLIVVVCLNILFVYFSSNPW